MSDDPTNPATTIPPWERSARFWDGSGANLDREALQAQQEGQLQMQLVTLQPQAASTAAKAVYDLRRRLGQALLQLAAENREVAEAYRRRAAAMRESRSTTGAG